MSWTQGVQGLNEHKKVRQIKAFGDWYCFFNKNSFSRLLGVGETETCPRKELRACTRRRRRRWCWNISCPRTLSRWSSPTWVRKGSRLLVSASQSDSSILIFCHLVALTFSDCCYSSESPKKAKTGTTSVILILKVCTWFQIKVIKKVVRERRAERRQGPDQWPTSSPRSLAQKFTSSRLARKEALQLLDLSISAGSVPIGLHGWFFYHFMLLFWLGNFCSYFNFFLSSK